MTKRLVIVESPAKARTIAGYLGSEYVVESSIGHVRDLPDRASEIPKEERKRYGALGVDVEHAFEPYYVVDPKKKKIVSELKKHLAGADELLLATDEDREGEAIAWHLVQVLKPKVPVRRMVFHEITRDAIEKALADTRGIDEHLVDAQETRRILDRLYGYEVSPVLWKKVTRGLSAGRVQSVATRLVVQRERERVAFVSSEYWDIVATLDPGSFDARLVGLDGRRVAQGRDFAPDGTLRDETLVTLDEQAARGLAERLEVAPFVVRSSDEKPYRRRPSAPFMTSTLQQEASRKLRFSAQTTMRLAQRLYEAGHITYMRTDSTTLAGSALEAARSQARELFGDDHVPAKPRLYERKVKNAQEAHEAIRPAGERFKTPEELKPEVSRDELALYELIWRRTLASQMEDAVGRTLSLRIGATTDREDAEFGASGTVLTFRGFLAAYEEGRDEPSEDEDERRLPAVTPGDPLTALGLEPEGHATTPPPRYTEPTLVRALEERGIGRPSTYAAILSTIVDRGYVFKKGSALVPTFVAFAVVNLLERHFEQLVDFDFTARMEDDLDEIAAGRENRVAWLQRFYFGEGGDPGLHHLVTDHLDEIDARAVNSIAIPGTDAVVRVGRYGPYLERGEERASLAPDVAPDELTAAKAEELLAQPDGRSLGAHPETGHEIAVRSGRYGPYLTEVLPEDGDGKPRTASLFRSMSPETVSLDDAVQLLSLPRVIGEVEGEEVTAQNGRYGPYVKKGSESRSLESEDELFTINLDDALALLAQPARRRGQRSGARAPLRELGDDPGSGRKIILKEGRFGPYVTDGETNASLRRGDTVEGLTPERATELLSEKRAKSG
ncbi:MAG: type I DNA topoisomerase [Actinobacteria bacterium]|nr:type I DNA topoisomerase [Actinomycetota bacterium]MBA3566967.1 type I DNA topoisomerase [Actinomycetota bacterium]